jgi:hypothetical protein
MDELAARLDELRNQVVSDSARSWLTCALDIIHEDDTYIQRDIESHSILDMARPSATLNSDDLMKRPDSLDYGGATLQALLAELSQELENRTDTTTTTAPSKRAAVGSTRTGGTTPAQTTDRSSYRHGVGYFRSPGNLTSLVTRSIGECRMSLCSVVVVSICPALRRIARSTAQEAVGRQRG